MHQFLAVSAQSSTEYFGDISLAKALPKAIPDFKRAWI